MAGGLRFSDVKSSVATVIENGACVDDPRVLIRTNEAIAAILSYLIPVNGMLTADVVATGTDLLLPKEFENAIEVDTSSEVQQQLDVTQGWYNIVNNFVYVDSSAHSDFPLVDLGLVPDPVTPTILRRKYSFPGLAANATVRVTGAKRYIPITADADYLIVQNPHALKLMIQSIEREENNDLAGAKAYRDQCLEELQAEVKKHLLDPHNTLKRKAKWETDLATYAYGTFGYIRARLAFELPNGLNMGKSELTRLLEMSEMRILSRGQYVGSLQEYQADVHDSHILAPLDVGSIIAIDLCCNPIDIKSLYFTYLHQGPGRSLGCASMLIDEGEVTYPNGGRRRQYRLRAGEETEEITFIGKMRWVKKEPDDFMVIRNFEALRLMAHAVMYQQQEKWNEAQAAEVNSINELQRELTEYLAGQIAVVNITPGFFAGCGGPL